MATTMQCVFFLSMFVSIGVCDPVFKLVGSSVQLDVQKKVDGDDLTWSFNKSENIVKYGYGTLRDFGRFKGRVKFNKETHSLTLYNIQKADSGLYQAEYSGELKTIGAAQQIIVLDPVKKPLLDVLCLPSTDTSNVSFTCEAQKLSITSHCYNGTCDMKDKNITGDPFLSLSLYISNNVIICNHSNPVSWKNTSKEIKSMEQLCLPEEPPGAEINVIIIIIPISLLVFLVLIFIFIFVYRRRYRTRESANTVYEEVDASNKGENNALSFEMSDKPGTVYCTVGRPAEACSNGNKKMKTSKKDRNVISLYESPGNNQGAEDRYEDLESKVPQTIYATVNKGGRRM